MLKSGALRRLMWVLLAGLLLLALAWLALPPLIKWQIESRGSEWLGRELRVAEVELSPGLALTLRGLSLAAAPGAPAPSAPPQLQADRVLVDLSLRSLWRLAPVIEALEIDAPRLHLARLAPGRYDIDDLLQRFEARAPQADAEPARFALFNLRVAGGEITFDDRPMQRRHELRQLTLGVPFLSNLPDHLQVKVEPQLAFVFNGSAFDSRGSTTPFAQGRASEFRFRLDPLDLKPWWAYLPAGLPLQPGGGLFSADLGLRFEENAVGHPQVQLSGQVELRDVSLQTQAAQPLLSWQSLRVRLADVRPLERKLLLDSLQLDGAVLHVRRDSSGGLELAQLAAARGAAPAAPATAGSAPSAPKPAARPWQLQLAQAQVQAAQLHWLDATVQPAAGLRLDGIELRLQRLHWPVDGDATLSFAARLTAADHPAGQLQAAGTLSDRQAKVNFKLGDIELAAAAPYLALWLQPQASARLQMDAELEWAAGDTPKLALAMSQLRVDDFRLAAAASPTTRRSSPAAPRQPLMQLQRLELNDVRADLLQRRLEAGTLALQRPSLDLQRDAAGVFNVSQWAAAAAPAAAAGNAAAPESAPAAATAPPWRAQLRELRLDGGRMRFADAALPAGPVQLDGVRLLVQGLAWPLLADAAPLPTQLGASLSLPGSRAGSTAAASAARLDWRGRIAPQPLSASGQLLLERFPVHVFEPYFGASMPVQLQRLEAGYKGSVELKRGPAGVAGQLRGDALFADLRIAARTAPAPAGQAGAAAAAAGAELLSWNALAMKTLGLTLAPGSKPLLQIGELRVSDYYSRLEITEEGRFNLQTVAVPAAMPGTSAASAAAAPAGAASAVQVSAPGAMLSKLPIDLLVESTEFINGRVDFNDRFIRPNVSAELSQLNGKVGRLDSRTRDMASVQLKGRVAGTGLLDIGGSLNPTVVPPALDLKAKATDIELPGISPYSAKYAGYPIERGKLSVDVAYKIDAEGKLEASNQIIVNQLTFGEKSNSPEATKLPVRLAVALLQDRNGVIDLDLPLSGSVNDPQFSMGALIWKVIVNVITKIVTSPFSMFAGAGGKDLSTVEFERGTAVIAESSLDAIVKVAKALDDRPGLKLSINGSADLAAEQAAMQRAALESRLLAERRRERARAGLGSAGTPAGDETQPPLTEPERARLLKQLYTDTDLPDKPRNLIGLAKDVPPAEMQAALEATVRVDANAARQLAVQRGRAVREALIAKGLSSERLFLGEPKLEPAGADNGAWVPQARLSLSTN